MEVKNPCLEPCLVSIRVMRRFLEFVNASYIFVPFYGNVILIMCDKIKHDLNKFSFTNLRLSMPVIDLK